MKRRIGWIVFSGLCLLVSLYPLSYLVYGDSNVLLHIKPKELLDHKIWKTFFYIHILCGTIALAIGWTQFSTTLRYKKLGLHRIIGQVYLMAVLFSGVAAVYISFYATGGFVSAAGFLTLALIWLYTSYLAYSSIRKKNIIRHQKMMTYNYAACCAAVTLRLWLPMLILLCDDFIIAYKIVAWLCWVPNLLVAHWINNKRT